MWNLNTTHVNISKEQKQDSKTENRLVAARGREVERERLGIWGSADAHCQQQGPTGQGRSYNQYPVMGHDRRI